MFFKEVLFAQLQIKLTEYFLDAFCGITGTCGHSFAANGGVDMDTVVQIVSYNVFRRVLRIKAGPGTLQFAYIKIHYTGSFG